MIKTAPNVLCKCKIAVFIDLPIRMNAQMYNLASSLFTPRKLMSVIQRYVQQTWRQVPFTSNFCHTITIQSVYQIVKYLVETALWGVFHFDEPAKVVVIA